MKLHNCSDDALDHYMYDPPAKNYRETIKLCCLSQQGHSCHQFNCFDTFMRNDTCCTFCRHQEDSQKFHSLIKNCCQCDESFLSAMRPEREVRCDRGFHYNKASENCEDIDECQIKNHGCDESQTCVNSQGSYSCIPNEICHIGFEFDEYRMTCKPGPLNHDLEPEELNMSSEELCPTGYRFDVTSNSCVDIDECRENRKICQFKCRNSPGSYRCLCRKGFKLAANNKTCEDINECAHKGRELCGDKICNNLMGRYICQDPTCPDGYKLLEVLKNEQT